MRAGNDIVPVERSFRSDDFAGAAPRCDQAVSGRVRRAIHRGERAFTMVEIAISLAVVAFALVAIIGVLPAGLQVQRDNREETIINADGTYLLEAIRSGQDPLNLLSNSIYYVALNFKNGTRQSVVNDPPRLSGETLVGLLSTPTSPYEQGVSNVVAWVRALNAPAINLDDDAREVAFRYQVTIENLPFLAYPPSLTNLISTNELARLTNLQTNLHEVRLTFRWPLFRDSVTAPQNARVGLRRRTFRTLVAGRMTNGFSQQANLPVFNFQPSTY
jgi:type II secretory pathway pseudopilin PulG